MDPNDREDSSRYVNEPRETVTERQEPTVVTPAPQPEPKPKKSKAGLILTLLLLLALAGAAVFGWLWYQQNGRVDDLEADLSSARNNVARLESAAKAESKLNDASDVTTETKDNESQAVVKAALAYMTAPVDPIGDNSREAKVEYLKDDFAKVVVKTSDVSPGGMSAAVMSFALTLKKSQGDWIVLSAAEGPVANMDELMKEYGIPREAF